MQFSIFASLALAAVALADSDPFGILVIRSGSQWQNSGVDVADGKLEAGVSGAGSATVTDDGELKLSDGSYAVIGTDSITTSTDNGSTGFSIADGYLSYDGSSGFSINDDGTVLAGSSGTTPVALKAVSSTGSSVADFTPSGSSDSSSSVVPESTSVTSESTSAAPESTSAAPESTTATIETYNSANGAAGLNAGVAGVLAVAAMLM